MSKQHHVDELGGIASALVITLAILIGLAVIAIVYHVLPSGPVLDQLPVPNPLDRGD